MLKKDLVRLAFHNIFLHKVRSSLTSLGIIFGVASVIAMLSISEGAKRESLAQIESMGTDKILLFSRKPAAIHSGSSTDTGMVQKYGITENDFNSIRIFENVSQITTARNARKKIMRGTSPVRAKVVAVSDDFPIDAKIKIIEGRWLSQRDKNNKIPTCVIGKNLKKSLFSLEKQNIVGEYLKAEYNIFKIVGICENVSGTEFPELGSPNDMLLIHQDTSDAIFGRNSYTMKSSRQFDIEDIDYDLLIIKIKDLSYIDNTAKRIKSYMEKTHKQEDWGITIPYELLKQREKTQNIFTLIMSSIAGISLLVGGIGIMNIMLANVYERRKEIGTRMALGAKKKDILYQFLLETIVLTLTGGSIGVLIGVLISEAVTFYADWKVVFTFWSFALSFVISTLIGVIFGTYPAWKASQQNPIEILRTE